MCSGGEPGNTGAKAAGDQQEVEASKSPTPEGVRKKESRIVTAVVLREHLAMYGLKLFAEI